MAEPADDAPDDDGAENKASAARRAGAWAALLILSIASTWALRTLHVPAALMLGPMLSAIVIAQYHGKLEMQRPVVMGAQALLGCRLGMAISPELLNSALAYLPILFAFVLAVVLATVTLAIVVSRANWFPGTAAVWGLSPGAASAMVMLAEMYGSDARIVAVMQYLRVLAAALVAILVGTLMGSPEANSHGIPTTGPGVVWFPPIDGVAFTETLALALLGAIAAWVSKRSIAILFVPMIGGAFLQISGLGRLELPAFLAAAVFAVIGWNIGLKFTRASLRASMKLMPRIAAVIAAMIALCGILSWPLAHVIGVDALSAYLALSPGGLDSVLIIATSTHVDLPLILAAQVVRLIVVMTVAPPLARLVVRRVLPGGRESG